MWRWTYNRKACAYNSVIENRRGRPISFSNLAKKRDVANVEWYVQDVLDFLSSTSKSYNIIFSNAALHWVADQDRLYHLIFKTLRPGGCIAIHQGAAGTYSELHRIAAKAAMETGIYNVGGKWSFPARYETKEKMESILLAAGFEDIHVVELTEHLPENSSIVADFSVASLSAYRQDGIDDTTWTAFENAFADLCVKEKPAVTSHRLYISAKRSR